jgi:hypothetical protein
MEVLLETVFSMWSGPRLYHATDRIQFGSVNLRSIGEGEARYKKYKRVNNIVTCTGGYTSRK